MLCNHFKVEKTECSSSVRCLYYTTCDVSKEKNPNYVFDPEGRSIKSFETLINIKQSRLGDIPHDRNSGSTTVTIVRLALLQLFYVLFYTLRRSLALCSVTGIQRSDIDGRYFGTDTSNIK